jgi:deoxyadenosine/deoxycytidine kinase
MAYIFLDVPSDIIIERIASRGRKPERALRDDVATAMVPLSKLAIAKLNAPVIRVSGTEHSKTIWAEIEASSC